MSARYTNEYITPLSHLPIFANEFFIPKRARSKAGLSHYVFLCTFAFLREINLYSQRLSASAVNAFAVSVVHSLR
ncbi:MAG: hypothetical protein JWO03_3907 [Bacteroidetes bacterium]|nr:hypothetical protein [Bacteroidota bacterium]